MCARCHRNKNDICAILRSGSELVPLSDRILLLVACRPRVRGIRACAVGTARRGARIGRLGAPCKAGGRWCSLTHGLICRRTPQFRAIGGSVGRAALRLETGWATCRSRATQDTDARRARFGRAWVVQTGGARWTGRTCDVRRVLACPPPYIHGDFELFFQNGPELTRFSKPLQLCNPT